MATDPMWCFENYGEAAEYIDELEAELTSLRAFKAACEGQEAVAEVVEVYGLVWRGSGPIAPIVRRNNIKVGTHLYANPDPEAAQLRMRIADLERQLANERASAIHTCGPDCPRSGCVERHERDQQVAEACAKVCDIAEEDYANREYHRYPELRTDAETGIGEVGYAILSGEWKKYMKGGE